MCPPRGEGHQGQTCSHKPLGSPRPGPGLRLELHKHLLSPKEPKAQPVLGAAALNYRTQRPSRGYFPGPLEISPATVHRSPGTERRLLSLGPTRSPVSVHSATPRSRLGTAPRRPLSPVVASSSGALGLKKTQIRSCSSSAPPSSPTRSLTLDRRCLDQLF